MIKNYNQFKESLLNKLEGPTEEEVWKSFGYEKTFDTYSDFLDYMFSDLKVIKNPNYPNCFFYTKNDKILFEVDPNNHRIYVDYFDIWIILDKIFNEDNNRIRYILNDEIHKRFGVYNGFDILHMSNLVNSRWWWNEKNHRDYKLFIKESSIYSEDDINNILDKGSENFSESDIAILKSYTTNDEELNTIIDKIKLYRNKFKELNKHINDVAHLGKPNTLMDEWVRLSRELSTYENQLKNKFKIFDLGKDHLIDYSDKYKFESLLNKLEGPNEEEVWKKFGYEKGFDTPEEFFLNVIDGIKVKEQSKYPESFFWEKNGRIIFEQDFKNNILYVDYKSIWVIFEKIYGLQYLEIKLFIKNMVEEYLNWNGLTSTCRLCSSAFKVEEYLNWNGLTPKLPYEAFPERWKNI